MRRLLAATVALALAAAAPAHAARGDRADAKAFAAAAKELRAAVLALRRALEENAHRLDRDPACFETFRHVPDAVAGDAAALIYEYGFEAQIQPVAAAYARFVDRISRLKVRDPALRRGRAAHRRAGRTVALARPAPADICTRLDAWRRAGYPEDGVPRIDDPGFDAAVALPKRNQKRLDAAGRRMRELGISRKVVRIWTTDDDGLFQGIDVGVEIPLGEATP